MGRQPVFGSSKQAQNLVNRMSSSVITIVSMLSIIAILSPLAVIVTIIGTIIENILHMITSYFDVKKMRKLFPMIESWVIITVFSIQAIMLQI